jgi:AcrR family transcriptional regulator
MEIIMNHVKSTKYQNIMQKAKDLFIRHGIKRVTVEEICKASGVSKMTFYKFFRNKVDLLKQILNEMINEGYQFTDSVMSQNLPFQEKARQNIKYKIEKIREYGDLFFQELLEIPELQPFLIEMTRDNINKILEVFKQGQREKAIRENIKPEFYQFLLEQISLLSDDDRLKEIFPDLGERVEELINIMFYGIFKREESVNSVMQRKGVS